MYVISLARKPLGESTVSGNVMRWGAGGLNLDQARLPSGRYPTNVLLVGKAVCAKLDALGELDSHREGHIPGNTTRARTFLFSPKLALLGRTYDDKGGRSKLFKFFDREGTFPQR